MLIPGSQIRTSMVAALLCLGFTFANAQDDPSQRPLPLPERGVTDLPQHMELLKRLRSLVESHQKNLEQPRKESETEPESSSSVDASSSRQSKNEPATKKSPVQAQQLQQFQEALKKLANSLPPGFVPPDLSSVPPDQLRRAMENPAVQQQMKQMLEQFAKDGVLPQSGDSGSQLPVPPRNDASQRPSQSNGSRNNGRQNNGTPESLPENEPLENPLNSGPLRNEASQLPEDSLRNPAEGDVSSDDRSPSPGDRNSSKPKEPSDPDNNAPPGSLRSLRSFLKQLAEDTGMKSPEASKDLAPKNETPPGKSSEIEPESKAATDEMAMPAEPKNSLGNSSVPPTRRPLRKRDRSKPEASPPTDSSNNAAQGMGINPSEAFPKTTPEPSNPRNAEPREDVPQNVPGDDSVETNPAFQESSPASPPQGLRIDPETARKQLEELQKTLERMKQVAEEADPGRSPTEEPRTPNVQAGRSRANESDGSSDSNSVAPSAGRNNRMANRPSSDNPNGDQLPEALPDVDEFLREQLKNFKLSPDTTPRNKLNNDATNKSSGTKPLESSRSAGPNQGTPDTRISRDSTPSDSGMERPLQPDDVQRLKDSLRPGNTDRSIANSSSRESTESDKPPIDIAKELEQRGFGSTLKQLVERAKEEAKKPRQPAPKPAEKQGIAGQTDTTPSDIENVLKDATGAAQKPDAELSNSMAKMLDGLKDDLVKIAKDARFNAPPEGARRERSMSRPSPVESNSMIDTLRKSASEILAGPSRSSNSVDSRASSTSTSASNAFSGEFDFTPVLVLAGVLAALAIGFWGLRHFKFRSDVAELRFAGPPLKPADINSRADVVRAFHEFALRSAQSVQSWWTHRTVQQAIVERAPEYRAAVETLANTYEQARYLPVEQELSPEQLESARSALQQCSGKKSSG